MIRLKLALVILLTIAAGCASTPEIYPPLEEAKNSLNLIKNEAEIAQVASVTIYEAEEQVKKAEIAHNENDKNLTDHYIYLSKRKQQIAQELLLKYQQEQELKNLKLQQTEMIAYARRTESKYAQSQNQKAQHRIRELEQAIGQYKAEESSRGTILVINDLLFDSGGAALKLQSQRRLEPLVLYLQGNVQREIIIEGHTDSLGEAETNKQLSLKRADAVKNFLIARGIDPRRIETRGFGEEVPVASNTTNAGRSLNRRVEIVIKTQY